MKPSSGITPLSRISSTLNPNKAMKDILVHYTSQERAGEIERWLKEHPQQNVHIRITIEDERW